MFKISKPIVVNLFGGAGAGKSMIASSVFSDLKWDDVSCELVTEYAKGLVWDDSTEVLDNQIYIFGKQYQMIRRVYKKVDVIVTDSPLLNSVVYNYEFGDSLNKLVLETHNKFRNMNYFVMRTEEYNPVGRIQSKVEAEKFDDIILDMFDYYDIKFRKVYAKRLSVGKIVDDILCEIDKE